MDKSIKFLAESQQKDGSFLSLTSADPINFKNATECQSVFSAALILSCLNALGGSDSDALSDIKKKAADFLLSQKSEHWSFNYWARGSKQSKEMPYPDDLDDTACSLAALDEYNPALIDGEALAGAVTVLTALESKEGGPYRTWLVPPDAQKGWMDIDLAVNSNIGYFLHLQEVKLENIVKLVESAIDNENYTSPYYPSVYPIIYFISRFYKGKKGREIVKFLLKKQKNNNWGNPLDTALAVLSLLNFGSPVSSLRESVEYLIQKKKKDSSWDAHPLYVGINPKQSKGDKQKHYAGSPALTTAFCIVAIHKVSPSNFLKKSKDLRGSKVDKEGDEIYKEVVLRAEKTFSQLGVDLRKQAEACLKKTIAGDKDKQIVLLPYFFLNGLEQKSLTAYSAKIIDMGLANLYGWMAYTIYDDFLDEEGNTQMLSVANVALRESYSAFSGTVPDTEFAEFVKLVFGRIDSANAWEVAHCRTKEKTIASALTHPVPDFNDITNLSDRSLGHVLGPIGVLCMLGYRSNSKESVNVLEGFRQYIAAKQIHDDMHDWEEDLSRGQINSASAALFSMVKNKKLIPKDEVRALQFLQQKFWDETVVILCDRAFTHINQARKLFLFAGLSTVFIDGVLNPLRATTELTLRERSDAKKFIVAYTGSK